MKLNIDFIYPVGSIYMSTNDVSPQTLFGGSWSKIEGRFLLGSSSSYPLGSTGGEATHKLTTNEIPKHAHSSMLITNGTAGGGNFFCINPNNIIVTNTGNQGNFGGTSSVGSDGAHNNMPPYQVVNIWKRTA